MSQLEHPTSVSPAAAPTPAPTPAPASTDSEWMLEPSLIIGNMFLDAARLSHSLLQQSDLTLDFCPEAPKATALIADIRHQLSTQVAGQWEQQLARIPQHIDYAGITPETDPTTCTQKAQDLITECSQSILESVNEFFEGWNAGEGSGDGYTRSHDPQTEQALDARIPLLHQHTITQIINVREMVIAGSISPAPALPLIESATEAFTRASNAMKTGLQEMVSSFNKKLLLTDPDMLDIAAQILKPNQYARLVAGVILHTQTHSNMDVIQDVMLPAQGSGRQYGLLASEAMSYCSCTIPPAIMPQHKDVIETDAAQAVQEVAVVVGSFHHFAATGALQPQIAEMIKESYHHNVAMGKKIVAALPAATPHFLHSLSNAYNAVCSYRDELNGHTKRANPNSTHLTPYSGYRH